METIQIKNKQFVRLIDKDTLNQTVNKLAEEISIDLQDEEPVFLPVLNGAFIFAADLLRKIRLNCQVSFVKLNSYEGTVSTQNVKTIIGLPNDLENKTVVIIEDIIDSGLTIGSLIQMLKEKNIKKIKIATLFFKPNSFKESYPIDYIGMNVNTDFIIGYGLDFDGYGRNLHEIYKMI